jgi:hypothetical protein
MVRVVAATLLAAGCGPQVMPAAETNGADTSAGTGDPYVDESDEFDGSLLEDVDILFVIDNSATMAEEQRLLAESLPVLIDALESPRVDANYRIAFTTTDSDNAWCAGNRVDAGQFVSSSCRTRIGDFESHTTACLDVCPTAWADFATTPTRITSLLEEVSRPWIQSAWGRTNLPAGLSAAQAAMCIAPQGIRGCGFEAPLESMYAALGRTRSEVDDELGFVRDYAALAIVFVTDDTDCSYNPAWDTIFLAKGNRVFWSLPDEGAPTAAVCWNAGVSCEPDEAGSYEDCVPADKDVDGNPLPDAEADADAALHPVRRYLDRLAETELDKKALAPSLEIVVSAIAGVPSGYPETPIPYADGSALFQAQFGIAPGCTSPRGDATPPVRLAAVADDLFSICEPSYDDAMAAIATRITDQLSPHCVRACVADENAAVAGVQPDCMFTSEWRDDDNRLVEIDLPECQPGGVLPDGADACVALYADRDGGTATTDDDLGPRCLEQGWNLEYAVIYRDEATRPYGADIDYSCTLSANKAVDCPGLPD